MSLRFDPDHDKTPGAPGLDIGLPWRLKDLWFVLAALGVVLGLLALGAAIDRIAERDDERRKMHLSQRLGQAYAAGQRDAHEALAHTPEGVELAQACLAAGFDTPRVVKP